MDEQQRIDTFLALFDCPQCGVGLFPSTLHHPKKETNIFSCKCPEPTCNLKWQIKYSIVEI